MDSISRDSAHVRPVDADGIFDFDILYRKKDFSCIEKRPDRNPNVSPLIQARSVVRAYELCECAPVCAFPPSELVRAAVFVKVCEV